MTSISLGTFCHHALVTDALRHPPPLFTEAGGAAQEVKPEIHDVCSILMYLIRCAKKIKELKIYIYIKI